MSDTPSPEVEKYVRLLMLMSVDYLLGKGPTHGAYIMNLKMITEEIEKLSKKEKT